MYDKKFDKIWDKIILHSDKIFFTKTDLKFKYEIKGDGFFPSRTKYRISKNDFYKAYKMVPLSGPSAINEICRGPSYIWAVLHDQRIYGY